MSTKLETRQSMPGRQATGIAKTGAVPPSPGACAAWRPGTFRIAFAAATCGAGPAAGATAFACPSMPSALASSGSLVLEAAASDRAAVCAGAPGALPSARS
jgi:hypothetical protein